MTSLDLALIGNGAIAALVNASAEITWACVPRFDGDPVFCSLLRERTPDTGQTHPGDFGFFAIDLEGFTHAEQEYTINTPVLVTRLFDGDGGCVEVTDFAPRFERFGRMFCPTTLVRQVRRLSGLPRIRVRVRPASDWGRCRRSTSSGSNHIRYDDTATPLRLTTDAPISAIVEENAFLLDEPLTFILGPDETVDGTVHSVGREFAHETIGYWRGWVARLAIPFEWQDAVIRAAISLKLNAVEDTGAIIAAVTTSIPEAADSGRNWDYRFCWLRDGYMVVNALNRLGATRTMERFIGFLVNVVAASPDGTLQPVYGISGAADLDERIATTLPGYRGMGPVRVGNLAFVQAQHDVYGSAVLAAAQVFFDRRLVRSGDDALFERLEALGAQAERLFDQPDAGIWEFRGRADRHTFSAVMCWAACDRLARIAAQLGRKAIEHRWRATADAMHAAICARAWNAGLGSFTSTFDGDRLDASLLLLNEVAFVSAGDPRFAGTVRAVEQHLMRNGFLFRYADEDGFGTPRNAFLVCSFWYVNALAALGRKDEARLLFERLLACRNRHGLFAEHIDPVTREQWGNFVQTYSMAGVINCAVRLSKHWDEAF